MGWAKRLRRGKSASGGIVAPTALAAVEAFDFEQARMLLAAEGCLELVKRLHEHHVHEARGFQGDEREAHGLVLEVGQGVARESIEHVWEHLDDEGARALLAQIVLAFYAWDPASVLVTTLAFDDQMEECLAVTDLVERLAEATRCPRKEILEELPDDLQHRLMSHGLLNVMGRPLGLLVPAFRHADLAADRGGVRLDGLLIERDPETGRPGRELAVHTKPLGDDAASILGEASCELHQFSSDEVLGSFRVGLDIVRHVRHAWDWQALRDAHADHE